MDETAYSGSGEEWMEEEEEIRNAIFEMTEFEILKQREVDAATTGRSDQYRDPQ